MLCNKLRSDRESQLFHATLKFAGYLNAKYYSARR